MMLTFLSTSPFSHAVFGFVFIFVFLSGVFADAQARIKVTGTEVMVLKDSRFGEYGYTARFEVQVEKGRSEKWVCGVDEVNSDLDVNGGDGKSWAKCISNYPTRGKLLLQLRSPGLDFENVLDDPGPLVEKNPFVWGPHIDANPINPVNLAKERLDRVEARGDLNVAVAYLADDSQELTQYRVSIPAGSLEFMGKGERGQYLLGSDEAIQMHAYS